jgi:hypothetical protein
MYWCRCPPTLATPTISKKLARQKKRGLKDILSNKRGLEECKRAQLNLNCITILSGTMPPKLENPEKINIPCMLGKVFIKKALCYLGASVSLMPHTIFEQMGIGQLKALSWLILRLVNQKMGGYGPLVHLTDLLDHEFQELSRFIKLGTLLHTK